jgi:undecaprenyl-diphosphatase
MDKLLNIDKVIFEWFQKNHIEWADYFCRDITSFGGPTGVIVLMLFATILMFILGQNRIAVINLLTILATTTIVTIMKVWIGRPAPMPSDPWHTDFAFPVPHLGIFPSGHTAHAVVLYLMFAFLAARVIPVAKNYLIWSALIFSAIIGFSRIYLGAHWMTDVVAGYIIGLAIIWLWRKF